MPLWTTCFQEALEQEPENTHFKVYSLCSTPQQYRLFQKPNVQTTRVHRLILIAMQAPTDPLQYAFIGGLEADEFEVLETDTQITQRVIYVGKVDTTGYSHTPRGVMAKTVCAYLKSQCPADVYVFARPQGQYLFRQSAKHPSKRVLSDRRLIAWWHRLLSTAMRTTPNETNKEKRAWWSIPGIDDAAEAQREIGMRHTNATSPWCYGYPYDPQARAADVIPRFYDDAKSRVLKTMEPNQDSCASDEKEDARQDGEESEHKPLTVAQFWALLGISEECGSTSLTGMLMAKLPKEPTYTQPDASSRVTENTFTLFWNDLMEQRFSSDEAICLSTSALCEAWTRSGLQAPLCVHGKGTKADPSSCPPVTSSPQVNVLSVKRKAATTLDSTPASAQPINVLTVKRKRTAPSPATATQDKTTEKEA